MYHATKWLQKSLALFLFGLLCLIYHPVAFAFAFPFTLNPNNPSLANKNYAGLSTALAVYQRAALQPWPLMTVHTLLKVHQQNPTVALLRTRLQATGDLPTDDYQVDNIFEPALARAVMHFQQRHGLKADGIVGKQTLQALNVPPAVRIKQIEINMQRWANLANQLGNRFILVNIPDFHLSVFEHNHEVLRLKTIVGKVARQTPDIHSRLTRMVFNPYWNVPQKIARKDIIPKVLDNPNYLTDLHIKVFPADTEDAAPIDPAEIDWEAVAENDLPYRLRQDPGLNNALGLVKFEFQNSADIYLHDTPAKNLFAENTRLFSSGCIRLENPFALVNYLMQTDAQWDEEYMHSILGTGKTTYIRVAHPIPIFITYLTAWVDEQGMLNFRDDIYGKYL